MDALQPHNNGFLEEWKSGCVVDVDMQIRHDGIEADVDSYMLGEETQELRTMSPTPHPLPLFPSLITRHNLAFNSKPIIIPHPLNINVSKCGHRSQNSSPPNFFIRQLIEVERERKTGLGDHPSGSEVARVTVSLDHCPDFGRTRV